MKKTVKRGNLVLSWVGNGECHMHFLCYEGRNQWGKVREEGLGTAEVAGCV